MSTAKKRVRAPATRKSTAPSASPTKIDKLTAQQALNQQALKRLRRSGAWPPAPPSFRSMGRIEPSD
jgi:hypothetical protein